jgi:hypothetical protein
LVRGDVSRRCEASMFSASFRSIPASCAVRLVLLFTASPPFAANRAFDATAAFTMPRFEALLLVSVTFFATPIVNPAFQAEYEGSTPVTRSNPNGSKQEQISRKRLLRMLLAAAAVAVCSDLARAEDAAGNAPVTASGIIGTRYDGLMNKIFVSDLRARRAVDLPTDQWRSCNSPTENFCSIPKNWVPSLTFANTD